MCIVPDDESNKLFRNISNHLLIDTSVSENTLSTHLGARQISQVSVAEGSLNSYSNEALYFMFSSPNELKFKSIFYFYQ
jgi:hypothetical protein